VKKRRIGFSDLRSELRSRGPLADRDPENARKIRDPVHERTMEAVHRNERTIGGGIKALFGALFTQWT